MVQSSFIEDRAYLVRFVVLFAVWGAVGFDYKLFMDLSFRGLALSALFFGASLLVVVGYRTRTAMLVLAATLLVHGLVFHHFRSLVGAGLTGLTALLPLGAYYSVDRWLVVGAPPGSFEPIPDAGDSQPPRFSRLLFFVLLLLIVGGPVYNQVFHGTNRFFRNWEMFAEIGVGLVHVKFETVEGGVRRPVDYMALLGHAGVKPGVRRNPRILADIRIVGPRELASVLSRVCAAAADPAALRLTAEIATIKYGWEQLYDGQQPVCASGAAR